MANITEETSLSFFLKNCTKGNQGKILCFDVEATLNRIIFNIAFGTVNISSNMNLSTKIGKDIFVKEFYNDLYENMKIQRWEKIKNENGIFAGLRIDPNNTELLTIFSNLKNQIDKTIKTEFAKSNRSKSFELDANNNIIGKTKIVENSQNYIPQLQKVYIAAIKRSLNRYKTQIATLSDIQKKNIKIKKEILSKISTVNTEQDFLALLEEEHNSGATSLTVEQRLQNLYKDIIKDFGKEINTYDITKIFFNDNKINIDSYFPVKQAMPFSLILQKMKQELDRSIGITSYNYAFDESCLKTTAKRYGCADQAAFLDNIGAFCSQKLFEAIRKNPTEFFFNHIDDCEQAIERLFNGSKGKNTTTLDSFVQFAFNSKSLQINQGKRHGAGYDNEIFVKSLASLIKNLEKKSR